jgi:hypothetical protein
MFFTHKPHVREGTLGSVNLGSQAHSNPISIMLSFLCPSPVPQASVHGSLSHRVSLNNTCEQWASSQCEGRFSELKNPWWKEPGLLCLYAVLREHWARIVEKLFSIIST